MLPTGKFRILAEYQVFSLISFKNIKLINDEQTKIGNLNSNANLVE